MKSDRFVVYENPPMTSVMTWNVPRS